MAYYGLLISITLFTLLVYVHYLVSSVAYLYGISQDYANISSLINCESVSYSLGTINGSSVSYAKYIIEINNLNYSCTAAYCLIYNKYNERFFMLVPLK